ncbi:MFS transporter [Curtobacterium sp. MCPF17_047]|uniref:MFS transporter n=1 Tax=Curtobacterium sp. MCPF17_047 TaxID=2175654 RepID=UPI001C651D2B|nr:MFS transporter [Curtobacterium sp. MCPF17_047]
MPIESISVDALPSSSGRSRAGAVGAVAVFAVIMLGGALPIPLYTVWAPLLRFGPLTTTVIFVAYVVGVVASLVLLGPVSDRSGRRPVLGIAIGVAALSTVLFAVATDVPLLLAGRLLSGVATGIATSTATAAIGELLVSKRLASAVSTASNLGGIGLGTIIGGVFGQSVPDPTRSVFWVYLIALGLVAVVLWRVPETVTRRAPVSFSPRRPVLAAGVGRRSFIGAALIVAAAFGVNGFFSSLAPTFLRDQLHVHNLTLSGLAVGLLFAAALAAQLLAPAAVLRSPVPGAAVLLGGVIVLLAGLRSASLAAFLAATIIAGAGVGLTFRRGLVVTDRFADPDHRADLGATYFLIAYLGLIAPTLTLGALDQVAGQTVSTLILAAIVSATAITGLVLTGVRPVPTPTTEEQGAAR